MKNTVRIVGGSLRGSRIRVPPVRHLRPTSGRNREMLFNWIGPKIHDAQVIDLFAGTGALGIEALSRGARTADFIESNRKVARILQENIDHLRLTANQVSITCNDTLKWLKKTTKTWDFVLIDPPFQMENLYSPILNRIHSHLNPDGLVYVEHARRHFLEYENYDVWKASTVGEVRCVLLKPLGESSFL